jgi:outer membrane protein assembly factor BamB
MQKVFGTLGLVAGLLLAGWTQPFLSWQTLRGNEVGLGLVPQHLLVDFTGHYYAILRQQNLNPTGSNPVNELFIARLDPTGELLWTQWYSTVEQGRQLLVYDADLDINSNLYLICGVLDVRNSPQGAMIFRCTPTGDLAPLLNIEEARAYYSIRCVQEGRFVIGFSHSDGRALLQCRTPTGQLVWQVQAVAEGIGNARYWHERLVQTADGMLLWCTTFVESGTNRSGIVISAYAQDGTLRWRRVIPSTGTVRALLADATGNIHLVQLIDTYQVGYTRFSRYGDMLSRFQIYLSEYAAPPSSRIEAFVSATGTVYIVRINGRLIAEVQPDYTVYLHNLSETCTTFALNEALYPTLTMPAHPWRLYQYFPNWSLRWMTTGSDPVVERPIPIVQLAHANKIGILSSLQESGDSSLSLYTSTGQLIRYNRIMTSPTGTDESSAAIVDPYGKLWVLRGTRLTTYLTQPRLERYGHYPTPERSVNLNFPYWQSAALLPESQSMMMFSYALQPTGSGFAPYTVFTRLSYAGEILNQRSYLAYITADAIRGFYRDSSNAYLLVTYQENGASVIYRFNELGRLIANFNVPYLAMASTFYNDTVYILMRNGFLLRVSSNLRDARQFSPPVSLLLVVGAAIVTNGESLYAIVQDWSGSVYVLRYRMDGAPLGAVRIGNGDRLTPWVDLVLDGQGNVYTIANLIQGNTPIGTVAAFTATLSLRWTVTVPASILKDILYVYPRDTLLIGGWASTETAYKRPLLGLCTTSGVLEAVHEDLPTEAYHGEYLQLFETRHSVYALGNAFTRMRGREVLLARYLLETIAGDIDRNGCVDDADLLRLLLMVGQSGADLAEDLNGDGVVDDADLLEVLFHFGSGC